MCACAAMQCRIEAGGHFVVMSALLFFNYTQSKTITYARPRRTIKFRLFSTVHRMNLSIEISHTSAINSFSFI